MTRSVAIFDLDHALLSEAPGPIVAQALRSQPDAPRAAEGAELLHMLAATVPVPLAGDVAVRGATRLLAGTPTDALASAGAAAADRMRVAPHARPLMAEHRRAGRRLVLTTHLPSDAAGPIAAALEFDAVVATDMEQTDGTLTGRLAGPVVWGRGKLDAMREWASANGASVRRSYAYSGSVHDAPLLAEVGNPVVCDPDPGLAALAWLKGWPTRSLHAPSGVLRVAGREIQDVLRPFARPELVPLARFSFHDLEHIPDTGPAIVCANHRSYFDVSAVTLAIAKRGRSVRGLGKKELFDAPVVGTAMRWAGGIRVERGTGSDEPLLAAAEALAGGELLMLMPEGTIPRGPAFFETHLRGRWGAARLAAMTKAPVIPLGLWGTERVWPRSHRLPRVSLRRPLVTVQAGPPVALAYEDPDADTNAIMAAIADLLPEEARVRRDPTDAELALTYPPGYKGDPEQELVRRPGSDA